MLEQFTDAVNGVWVSQENVKTIANEAEKYLVRQFKLAYMGGKGKEPAPVLMPLDLIDGMQLLISKREEFGISTRNLFVFATKSALHCSGWHAVNDVYEKAGVSVNATQNRHMASTVYAGLDMSESDRRVFFSHLVHDELINKENYQCPAGIREIKVMGKFLNDLDGKRFYTDTQKFEFVERLP